MVTLTCKFRNGREWSKEFESITEMLLELHLYVMPIIEHIEEVFSTQDNVIVFYKKGLS